MAGLEKKGAGCMQPPTSRPPLGGFELRPPTHQHRKYRWSHAQQYNLDMDEIVFCSIGFNFFFSERERVQMIEEEHSPFQIDVIDLE